VTLIKFYVTKDRLAGQSELIIRKKSYKPENRKGSEGRVAALLYLEVKRHSATGTGDMHHSYELTADFGIPEGPRPDAIEYVTLQQHIGRLIKRQLYAVLCTQGQSQPYGSLVAFAASEDLKSIVFSTPVATRKYRLLSECEHVALLVDNRSAYPHDLMQIEAVTATGRARVVAPSENFDRWAGLLIDRHPHLADFVLGKSCALVRVAIERYFHVGRFQEVRQWVPGAA